MHRYLSGLVAIVLVAGFAFAQGGNGKPSDVIKLFDEQVKKYVDLHKKVDAGIPSVENIADPKIIVQSKEQFAKAMQEARPHAKQGDIFIPPVRRLFVEMIKQELSGPLGQKARAIVLGEDNPNFAGAPPITIKVNSPYPPAAPLSTVPPSLLLRFPKLPEQLEYRFVGRHLILRDTKAGLVVDFISNAVL